METIEHSGADWNDITYIYWFSHGEKGENDSRAISGKRVYDIQILIWLRSVPGKIVFIVDSCYSGRFARIAREGKSTEMEDGKPVNTYKISLDSDKFIIITSSEDDESARFNPFDMPYFSENLIKLCTYPYAADHDPRDGVITKGELLRACPETYYINNNTYHTDSFGNDDFVLFTTGGSGHAF